MNHLLKMAVRGGIVSAVRLLMERGFDLDLLDKKGMSVLMYASAAGHLEVCRVLVNSGANPFIVAPDGRDALSCARENYRTEVETFLLGLRTANADSTGAMDAHIHSDSQAQSALNDELDSAWDAYSDEDGPEGVLLDDSVGVHPAEPHVLTTQLPLVFTPHCEMASKPDADLFEPDEQAEFSLLDDILPPLADLDVPDEVEEDLFGWEPDSEVLTSTVPDGELRQKGIELQQALTSYVPISGGEDWSHITLSLPDQPYGGASKLDGELEQRARLDLYRLLAHESRPDVRISEPTPFETSWDDFEFLVGIEDSQYALVRSYLDKIAKIPKVNAQQERRLGAMILAGGTKGRLASQELVEGHLGMVIGAAQRYVGKGIDLPDLIQEGNIGLIKAAEKFDFSRGFRFSTYAGWWIRQSITRAIADKGRTIRLPVHLESTLSLLSRSTSKLEVNLGRQPSAFELATEMEESVEKVRSLLTAIDEPISLDMPLAGDPEFCFGDLIVDQEASTLDDVLYELMMFEVLFDAILSLSERESQIICSRYGLIDGRFRTLEEVGTEKGVTRERIRQIEVKALAKLTHPTKSRRLHEYVKVYIPKPAKADTN